MEFRDQFLDVGEWIEEKTEKDKIFLHHTAGSHRPDWTAAGWNRDRSNTGNRKRIATAFVIGGKSTRDGNSNFDGIIIRVFPEDDWAFHLGVRGTAGMLDKKSIGIEICNYGPLTLTRDGRFFNYVKGLVPEDQVVELDEPFRGYTYFHKYTDAQLDSLSKLIKYFGNKFNIPLSFGLRFWIDKKELSLPKDLNVIEQQKWLNANDFVGKDGNQLSEDGKMGPNTKWAIESVGGNPFEYNTLAVAGNAGLWTHSNVRKDKFDCSPQKNLIDLIQSL